MECPGCTAEMRNMTVETRVHTPVEIDLCTGCQAIWFDKYHDLQVSPESATSLRKLMETSENRAPQVHAVHCPRCGSQLLPTHDMQRNTHFSYWRCPDDHGRFIGFVDFLREKDLIRELSPDEVQEMRKKVQNMKLSCVNCGAPIDLASTSACAYCGSPVSMVDMKEER